MTAFRLARPAGLARWLRWPPILAMLEPEERSPFLAILGLSLLTAALEIATAAALIPFLSLLSDPGSRMGESLLGWVVDDPDALTAPDRLRLSAGLSFALLVGTAALRLLTFYRQNVLFEAVRSALASRLFRLYLEQPYRHFLATAESEAARNVLNEVDILIGRGLMPLTALVVSAVSAAGLILFLLVVSPVLTLVSAALLCGAYGLIYVALLPRVRLLGIERSEANTERFRTVGESFAAIKMIKLTGVEPVMASAFAAVANRIGRNLAESSLLAMFPKSLFEVVGFGGIVLVSVLAAGAADPAQQSPVLPLIGTFAYVLYRLLPLLQSTYQNGSSYAFAEGIVADVSATLARLKAGREAPAEARAAAPADHALELEEVSFAYAPDGPTSLEAISLRLEAGSTLGVCGRSGAGKTTLIDVVTGLLLPTGGRIAMGGTVLSEATAPTWRQAFGYVPQDTVLIEGTVIENVALGAPLDADAVARARDCLRVAQLEEFVEDELPDGERTRIGGSGVRISGGQRQRLGIARALFRQPRILILDEATSALDTITEQRVMEGLRAWRRETSIVAVAHRLSTLRGLDRIAVMARGRLLAVGTHAELLRTSGEYRDLEGGA